MAVWSTFDIQALSDNKYRKNRVSICDDHDTLPSEIGGIVQHYFFIERGEVSPITCCYLCDKIASEA